MVGDPSGVGEREALGLKLAVLGLGLKDQPESVRVLAVIEAEGGVGVSLGGDRERLWESLGVRLRVTLGLGVPLRLRLLVF